MNAYEWGLAHSSCPEALKWRKSLGPDATQADAWKLCQRGDWMGWQLRYGLSAAELRAVMPALLRATDKVVERVIRHVMKSLEGNDAPWAVDWWEWAVRWLTGDDRSAQAAEAAIATQATKAAAWETVGSAMRSATWATMAAVWASDAARAARAAEWAIAVNAIRSTATAAEEAVALEEERVRQAKDLRSEIPEWPGEVN